MRPSNECHFNAAVFVTKGSWTYLGTVTVYKLNLAMNRKDYLPDGDVGILT